ncbi:MAG TPA: ubiquinone/menaquinone biosynthesis methyltransferase [Candidatus Limnocylindrales bacterium]|nr:ubiquinone/menaquinone biosynthesis methyltransferase [Candidatus Limnocylindrales bacterium]
MPSSGPRGGGRVPRSGNQVPQAQVTAMFDGIAPVYDRMNTVMTAGLDGRWRRLAVRATGLRPGQAAIDVACGTGKLALALTGLVGPQGRVEAVDLSPAMIDRARAVAGSLPQLRFAVADALALPFPDATFEAATIGFGLRNLPDFEAGFRELARVVKPGGRVVCLELSLPPSRPWARLYHGLFRRTAPSLARLAGGGRQAAYAYLPASLDDFPDAAALAATMRSAGLTEVRFRRLATGIVALHVGLVTPQADVVTP